MAGSEGKGGKLAVVTLRVEATMRVSVWGTKIYPDPVSVAEGMAAC